MPIRIANDVNHHISVLGIDSMDVFGKNIAPTVKKSVYQFRAWLYANKFFQYVAVGTRSQVSFLGAGTTHLSIAILSECTIGCHRSVTKGLLTLFIGWRGVRFF
jgi:hypothetical protein